LTRSESLDAVRIASSLRKAQSYTSVRHHRFYPLQAYSVNKNLLTTCPQLIHSTQLEPALPQVPSNQLAKQIHSHQSFPALQSWRSPFCAPRTPLLESLFRHRSPSGRASGSRHGAWSMERGAWSDRHGASGHGAWSMERGAWGMGIGRQRTGDGRPKTEKRGASELHVGAGSSQIEARSWVGKLGG